MCTYLDIVYKMFLILIPNFFYILGIKLNVLFKFVVET